MGSSIYLPYLGGQFEFPRQYAADIALVKFRLELFRITGTEPQALSIAVSFHAHFDYVDSGLYFSPGCLNK